jgi:hypothetical protein
VRATILAAMVVALTGAGTLTGCTESGTVKLCDVTYAGLSVNKGRVVDTVRPVCDKPPQSHILKAVIEFQVGGEWIERGRAVVVDTIPDNTGFPVQVSAECREGVYRTHVHVEGLGPDGKSYTFDDTGREKSLTLVDCAG